MNRFQTLHSNIAFNMHPYTSEYKYVTPRCMAFIQVYCKVLAGANEQGCEKYRSRKQAVKEIYQVLELAWVPLCLSVSTSKMPCVLILSLFVFIKSIEFP